MKILDLTLGQLFPDFIGQLNRIPDTRLPSKCLYSLPQIVFCSLMLFLGRYRSLHSFVHENRGNEQTLKNFQEWMRLPDIPSDDAIRYGLYDVPVKEWNSLLAHLHRTLDRKKILRNQKFFGTSDLVCIDGTGQFNSAKINCPKCMDRITINGIQYCHHQLLATLTNQKGSYSLPIYFEPIDNTSIPTYDKNDCELNACKRLLTGLRSHYPKRTFTFLGDNLFAASTVVELIRSYDWHFILTAKPERNKELFSWYQSFQRETTVLKTTEHQGTTRVYKWKNQLPLKQTRDFDKATKVNLLEYVETDKEGVVIYENAWITDFEITPTNVQALAAAGRARFAAIENRAFNEQKNLGFQTEHSFGHGGELPNSFFALAQIAKLFTQLFRYWIPGRTEIKKVGGERRYFERLAVLFGEVNMREHFLKNELEFIYLKFDFESG